jgi:hypothetical protein
LVATEAVAIFITGLVRTHYRNLSMKLAKSKRSATRSVSGTIPPIQLAGTEWGTIHIIF